MILLDLAAKTDRGVVRETNQDVADAAPDSSLILVADGRGPRAYGDIASRMASKSFREVFRSLGGTSGSLRQVRGRVITAFRCANETIGGHPAASLDTGFGTSLVVATFLRDQAIIAHVGDSRCYRLRGNELSLLTPEPESLTELEVPASAEHEPAKEPTVDAEEQNGRERYVDGRARLEIDTLICEYHDDDAFILCSKGLWGAVRDESICRALEQSSEATEACDRLIGAAWAAGGLDNVAVAVALLRSI